MKTLASIEFTANIIALCLGDYLQFSVVPNAEAAKFNSEIAASVQGDTYYSSPQSDADFTTIEAKTEMGKILLLAGAIAFLLSIVPAIKKQKIAWAGVVLGLGTLFLGVAYGTHMFS